MTATTRRQSTHFTIGLLIIMIILAVGYITHSLITNGTPPSISNIVNDPEAIVLTDVCRSDVDGLINVLGRPNDYFKALTHLKMAPGYTLDYVMYKERMGSNPVLYARETGSEPFEDYAAFWKVYQPKFIVAREHPRPMLDAYAYIDEIQSDQSPESYFQVVALITLGEQFSLYWHGLLDDTKIVCDAGDMEEIRQIVKPQFKFSLPDFLEQAKKIDYRPAILINEETISLRIVTFTKWGGFFERLYVFDQQNPTRIIDIQSIQILKYDCNTQF